MIIRLRILDLQLVSFLLQCTQILKNRKVIGYKQMFLMYPMHKDEIVELLKPDWNPETDA